MYLQYPVWFLVMDSVLTTFLLLVVISKASVRKRTTFDKGLWVKSISFLYSDFQGGLKNKPLWYTPRLSRPQDPHWIYFRDPFPLPSLPTSRESNPPPRTTATIHSHSPVIFFFNIFHRFDTLSLIPAPV